MITTKKLTADAAEKTTAVAPVAEKKVEVKAAEPKKEEVKKEEVKKPEVKKPEAKKAEPKKTAAKKAEPKKTVAKKAEPKKAVAKKTTAKKETAVNSVLYVQFGGKELTEKALISAAKKAYVKLGNKAADIKKLEIYLKPEEHVAYYVVNGKGSDEFRIEL